MGVKREPGEYLHATPYPAINKIKIRLRLVRDGFCRGMTRVNRRYVATAAIFATVIVVTWIGVEVLKLPKILGLVNVAQDQASDSDRLKTLVAIDGSLVVIQSPPEPPKEGQPLQSSMAALVGGELAVTSGGCLGIREPDGTERAIIWPSQTVILNDAVGVDVPDMGIFRVGDIARGGGGYLPVTFEGPLKKCPSGEVAFLNEDQR